MLLLAPLGAVYLVLVGAPTLGLIIESLMARGGYTFALLTPERLAEAEWTLDHYIRLFTSGYYLEALGNTVALALWSAAISVVVGTPIAYLLVRRPGRLATAVEWVLSLPIYLSGVLCSYAVLLSIGGNGPLALLLGALTGTPVSLSGTQLAVVIGSTYIVLPMYIRVVKAGLLEVRDDQYEAALTMGSREWRTFRTVVLPQVLPSVAAGFILSTTYAMTLVVVILILGSGGASFTTLPLEIMSSTGGLNPQLPFASAMAIVLLVVSLVLQLLSNALIGGRRMKAMV
jgi:ABC-type Fe3+ transport system permease subunit